MKNLKYFSFERNKYFYGKLLSVEDFETEQRYMNDKRRLLNRFVNGCGVLCGMNVVAIDDATISVERGIALDFAGREIVVDNPVTKKLSMIDGFEDYSEADEENSDLYLCIRYQEESKEAVHSISTAQTREIDDVEYNKYEEGYNLYLTNQEPESMLTIADYYYKNSAVIYRGNGFSIKQEMPKYMRSNSESAIRITVEKTGQSKGISFSYALESSCIKDPSGQPVIIAFNEEDYEKSNQYVIQKKIRTIPVVDAMDKVKIMPGSFKLTIGKKKVSADAEYEMVVNVTQKDIRQQIVNTYYRDIMNEVTQNSYEHHIYLARLSVVKAGATYIIDSVNMMPFNQYLFNNMLTTIMQHLEFEYPQTVKKLDTYKNNREIPAAEESSGQMVATGETMIDLEIGGSVGQRFYSGEISHGLGLGNVYITLGIDYTMADTGHIIYGDQSVFQDKDEMVNVELAAKVDIETGKFVIGLKCLEPTDARQIRINWMAFKDKKEVIMEKARDTMHIMPDMINMGTKETQYYEAIIDGETESRVRWSVKEENGGMIDENGMYTAPNRQGVFEIIAESMDIPGMKASTFVVVRDKK